MPRKTLLVICLIAAAILLLNAIISAGLARRSELQFAEATAALTTQISSLEGSLALTQEGVDALLAENQQVSKKLDEERSKRVALESQRANEAAQANQKIAELEQGLATVQGTTIASVVNTLRPRVASVRCRFDLPGGTSYEDAGSGTVLSGSAPLTVITNRHVITRLGYTANYCAVKFPDDPVVMVVQQGDISPSFNGVDWGRLFIRTPSSYATQFISSTAPARCTDKAQVGESVLILGYPSIGARDDVTVTEGIISGFEQDFYISSAKVERGNSGGAAILTKKNCYLGAPTYVGAGQLETLARILDQSKIQ